MKPFKIFIYAVSLGAAGLVVGQNLPPAPAAPAAPAPDPLEQINVSFHDAYDQAKAAWLARSGPVLLLAGERVALYRDGVQVAEQPLRPALYHRLKEVAHLPVGLYLLLSGPGSGADPAARLRPLRALAAAAEDGLERWCPPEHLPRQRQILEPCLRLLDQTLAQGPSPERLARFAAELGPLVLANADAAAAQELQQLDQAVARLGAGLAAQDRLALKVVIAGAHMAREGEVSLQYFLRLLGERGEGGRVVYAEGLGQPREALGLLATHQVDLGAGAAFFKEPGRMHRDLLADGARRWLDAHAIGNGSRFRDGK
jgi:hypothetical protein